MLAPLRLRIALGFAVGLVSCAVSGQSPREAFERAHSVLLTHTHYGFSPDGTAEAIAATQQMWAAVADFVVEETDRDPNVSVATLNHSLCLLTVEPMPPEAIQESPEEQCETRRGNASEVAQLAPHLLLVAPSVGEGGTVFILGPGRGKTAVLWSIADAGPQRLDPHDLIGAWRPERAGDTCYSKSPADREGACGPLYANVGVLPPDDKGRPRFYIDAGYEQSAGASIGKQTSIWRWDGERAELQWIDMYSFMIDQGIGTSYDEDKGVLLIGQKGNFRTMYDCGSCIERPMEERVLMTKTGLEYLGVRSLVPEMDAIDEFLWRLSHRLPTSEIASVQASSLLRSQVRQATKESRNIDPAFYSVGMVSGLTKLTNTGAEVCLETDELDELIVKMRRTADGGYYITHVAQPSGAGAACPERAYYTAPDGNPSGR